MTARARLRFGRALAALAAVSIAVTALALAARAWWVAELFTHFRLQLVAGQLVLVAALAALGRGRVALLTALAAGLNSWHLHAIVWPATHAVAAAGDELRLMTVNVAARNDEHERLFAMIEREQPDVILVVELTERWRRHLKALEADYAYRELVPRDDAFGLGLLSRHPLDAVSIDNVGATPAIDARVGAPGGPFRLLGVHLVPPTSGRRAAERNRQLERLAERRAAIDGPLVVLGDFNVSPYSPHYSDWLASTALTDTLAGRGPSATWPAFLPVLGTPIDHCFVSEHFTVVERHHLPAFGSDHYPVLVRVLHGGGE